MNIERIVAKCSRQDDLRRLNLASSVGQDTGFTEVHGSPSPECPAAAVSFTSLSVRPRDSAAEGLQLRALEVVASSNLAVKKGQNIQSAAKNLRST